MKIGLLAETAACPIETIRYYEKIGLLPKPERLPNGYRDYHGKHLKWLQFILRCRALGFTQNEVKRLSGIAQQTQPDCSDVHELLVEHLLDVQKKLLDLRQMENALIRLTAKCQDGSLNDCPVIDELMDT